jgi:hypothetical protein
MSDGVKLESPLNFSSPPSHPAGNVAASADQRCHRFRSWLGPRNQAKKTKLSSS